MVLDGPCDPCPMTSLQFAEAPLWPWHLSAWGALTGATVKDQDAARLRNNRWGAELVCLPLCPTSAQT